jgi:Flp pilus assembly CpaF family ATPase
MTSTNDVQLGFPPQRANWPEHTTAETPTQRLRDHLRRDIARELPTRVDAAHRAADRPVVPAAQRQLAQQLLEDAVRAHCEAELLANRQLPSPEDEQRVVSEVLNELFGMAGLQPLLDDPDIETINITGHDRVFVQYTGGRRARLGPVTASDTELVDLVRTLASRASSEERRFDRASPAVNLQLPGGERLFAVMALTSGGRPVLSIRRHGFRTVTLADLADAGTVDIGLRAFLAALVRARRNILITARSEHSRRGQPAGRR